MLSNASSLKTAKAATHVLQDAGILLALLLVLRRHPGFGTFATVPRILAPVKPLCHGVAVAPFILSTDQACPALLGELDVELELAVPVSVIHADLDATFATVLVQGLRSGRAPAHLLRSTGYNIRQNWGPPSSAPRIRIPNLEKYPLNHNT